MQKKKRIVARVQCRNIKNECPLLTCDEPVLLPGRCCKSCPGDFSKLHVQLLFSQRGPSPPSGKNPSLLAAAENARPCSVARNPAIFARCSLCCVFARISSRKERVRVSRLCVLLHPHSLSLCSRATAADTGADPRGEIERALRAEELAHALPKNLAAAAAAAARCSESCISRTDKTAR